MHAHHSFESTAIKPQSQGPTSSFAGATSITVCSEVEVCIAVGGARPEGVGSQEQGFATSLGRRVLDTESVIVRNKSTLVVLGHSGATAAAVSAATGLAPTSATEAGDTSVRGSVHSYSVWHLEVESDVKDESGFGSMRVLLAQLLPAAEALRGLSSDYEVRLDWGGFSNSTQGGFVLEPDIAHGLANLGLPLYGTAHVD